MNSLDRLDNCIKVLDDTTIVGGDTIITLNEQGEKIKLIRKKTENMNPQISRSRYIVSNMFARLRNNKIIQWLIILLLISIAIMLIILIATKK